MKNKKEIPQKSEMPKGMPPKGMPPKDMPKMMTLPQMQQMMKGHNKPMK